jgi:predicted nucleic acid-binding protein
VTEVFADSFSFEIMQQRGITQALSADHHFRQAGFQTLFYTLRGLK